MHPLFWTYFDLVPVLIETILILSVACAALVSGFRPVERWVDDWAAARGLVLTPETRLLVVSRLRFGRRVRTVGFVAGWLTPLVTLWIVRDARYFSEGASHHTGPLFYGALVGGYLAAAILVELWFARQDKGSRAASLEPRNLRAYLPAYARWTPRLAAVAAVALVPVYAFMPLRGNQSGWPSVRSFAAIALVAPALVLGIEALQRLIVRRRQPFTTEALVRADDALRSASISKLGAVAIAVTCLILLPLCGTLAGRTDVQVLRWAMPFVLLALAVTGSSLFHSLRDPGMRWRVPRARPAAGRA